MAVLCLGLVLLCPGTCLAGAFGTGWEDEDREDESREDEDWEDEDWGEDGAWQDTETVTIIWHSNLPGNDETMEDADYAAGEQLDWYPYDEWVADGKAAVGFSTDPDAEEPVPYLDDDRNYFDMKAADGLELYLVWKEAVRVTLDGNGARARLESDDLDAEPVYEGEEVISENIPLGQSYYLDDSLFAIPGQSIFHWEDEDGRVYEGQALYNFREDVVLKACWAPSCHVSLDPGEGFWRWEGTSQEKKMITAAGKEIIPPEADRDGYVLTGWSTQPEGESAVNAYGAVRVDQDMTLYALWKKSVNIIFDGNGGQISGSNTLKIEKGDCLAGYDLPDLYYPDDDHMTFVGWALHRDDTEPFATWERPFEKDATVYALWEKGYLISFDLNGGKRKDNLAESFFMPVLDGGIIFSSQYYYDIFAEGDKVFVGWTLERDDPDTLISQGMDLYTAHEDATLYAYWVEGCEVVFHGNGGKVLDLEEGLPCEEASVEMAKGQAPSFCLETVAPSEDEVLLGWSLEPSGDEVIWNAVTMETDLVISEKTDLYAVWADGHTVTFHGNGTVINMLENTDTFVVYLWPEGEPLHRTPDLMLGQEQAEALLGWSLEPSGDEEQIIDLETFPVTEDTDLYAVWKKS